MAIHKITGLVIRGLLRCARNDKRLMPLDDEIEEALKVLPLPK